MAAPLEIAGALKRTEKGNADWYYGGGDVAWSSIAAARAGVPAAIRPGKTVGVIENHKIVEYVWPDNDTSDGALFKKTADIDLSGYYTATQTDEILTDYAKIPDGLRSVESIIQDGSTITVTNAIWRINGVDYTTGNAYDEFIIPAATEDNRRIDLIVGNTSSQLVLVQGTEGIENIVEPDLPAGTVRIAPVYVNGSTVQPPQPDLSVFARLGGGNNFTGNQNVLGDMVLGDGHGRRMLIIKGGGEGEAAGGTIWFTLGNGTQLAQIGNYSANAGGDVPYNPEFSINTQAGLWLNPQSNTPVYSGGHFHTLSYAYSTGDYRLLVRNMETGRFELIDVNLSGDNTGDETTQTILQKIGDGSKIGAAYLPSYVDDVMEFANYAALPAPGEPGKIYITTDNNKVYRYSGATYIEIVASPGSSDSIAEGATHLFMTPAERTKLGGVAVGATQNDTDANLKNRANHTGTQPASTISDFNSAAVAANATAVAAKLTGTAATDAETQITATVTEDNKFISRLKLFNWWTWIKTQAQSFTGKIGFSMINLTTINDPAMPVNGDIWLNLTNKVLKAYLNDTLKTLLTIETNPAMAGIGNRLLDVDPAGTVNAVTTLESFFIDDADIITAINASIIDASGRAYINPANGKTMLASQMYLGSNVAYIAESDNYIFKLK